MRANRRAWVLLAAAALAGLSGCGGRTYPVKGTVVFEDGTPATGLAGGFVSFQSTQENVSAQGVIGRDATFTLTTFKKGDGAVPGAHRVVITPPPYQGSEAGPAAPPLLDPRYCDPATSGLEVEVKPEKNDIPIALRRPVNTRR